MSHPFLHLSLRLRPFLVPKIVQIPLLNGRTTAARAISGLRPGLVSDQQSIGRRSDGKNQLLVSQTSLVMQHRFKKGKAGGKSGKEETDESDDEDDDSDKEEELNPDEFLDVEIEGPSNRLDIAARGGLGITRESAIDQIGTGMIRLNGLRAAKTDPVSELDIIDLIKGRNPEDPSKLDVCRCQITSVPDIATSKGRVRLKGRRWRKLTIDNYKEEPFESMVSNTEATDEEQRYKK